MLEVCIDSLESALNAVHGGANELEVCSSLNEGGLTPPAGLVKEILKMVNKIPQKNGIYELCSIDCSCMKLNKKPNVNIMIRCRTGTDFCYTQEEMDTMLADISIFKDMGVDRFVFGALTRTQEIHEEYCATIIRHAHPTPVTFHRAFDLCNYPMVAVEKLKKIGFDRILTSGQRRAADDPEALKLIKILVDAYGQDIDIMPGSGVNLSNARKFIEMGCKIIHSSCKIIKELPKIEKNVSMGTNEVNYIYVTDSKTVELIVQFIRN